MLYTEKIKKALEIAFDAHKDQVDKAGLPYIYHPFYLATQMDTEESIIVALLHDVVEDSPYTFEDIEHHGFSSTITKSASFPNSTDPISLSLPNACAPYKVAARITSKG